MYLDGDCLLRNIFWVNARSWAANRDLGDVIMFDLTYLTNEYDMHDSLVSH